MVWRWAAGGGGGRGGGKGGGGGAGSSRDGKAGARLLPKWKGGTY